jgi:hypothetical protein
VPPKPVTFLVPGTEAAAPLTSAAASRLLSATGELTRSVAVSSQRAASGAAVPVTAVPGKDVVVLHIDGGPSLVLHPENARDLLLSQNLGVEAASARTTVPVPVRLQWSGLENAAAGAGVTRGFLGSVALKAVDVVTGLNTDAVAKLAVAAVVERFDGQLNAGVHALQPDVLTLDGKPLATVPGAAKGETTLVLVHGTFSSTTGTFGKLWTNHPDRVQRLFSAYGNRVYALEHPTLSVSPIDNALALAKTLTAGARLHLLTHSRGGLVGEVLARVCANPEESFDAFAAKGDAPQRQTLRELAQIVKSKTIVVERLVRVACPARGTLLASRRLDAYLSVLKWALDLAGIPVAPGFVELLAQVARHRTDPQELPGLAAQIPDSPLIRWLYSPVRPSSNGGASRPDLDETLAGDLRVVAGDIDGDSVASWVKTLLADSFFWTDNDLVVQTRSMYGGLPRAAATFVLDEGGRVSHFNYFANEHTAGAIVNALTQERPAAFAAIGPLSWSGKSATGTRAARRPAADSHDANRPALVLVPGVFGSHLRAGERRIWLDRNASGGLEELQYRGKADRVAPDGLLDLHAALATTLARDHEVIEFAYDWRRPLEQSASSLANVVADALARRKASGAAVRLIAHSSGGLLVRALPWTASAIWRRFAEAPGSRALLLGPPNGGTWLPMQLLTGDETLGNLLPSAARPFATAAVRQMFAGFPGLLQLQADVTDRKTGLAKTATWKALAAADMRMLQSSAWHDLPIQRDPQQWGIPPQSVLDAAAAFRRRLDGQQRGDLGGPADLLVMVTGKAPLTADGFEAGGQQRELVYLDAQEGGDGRVPAHRARLDGIPAWSADADHAGLVTRDLFFEAYLELLAKGETSLLPRQSDTAEAAGGAPAIVRSRPSRSAASSAPPQQEVETLLVRPPVRQSAAPEGPPLEITVVNGDLTFVAEPLLLGHYRASRLTGTERVMDGLIGGAMDEALRRGLYPVKPGSQQVFINTRVRPDNPWQPPRPRAVIVAGLGEEGSLRAAELTTTVRQAVIAWAQRVAEEPDAPDTFTLATTLIGSGGTGVSAAEAAQLIARGVREANQRSSEDGEPAPPAKGTRAAAGRRWPRVKALRIIELYGDRAGDAWRALQLLSSASPSAYALTGPVEKGTGALRQPLESGYRGAEFDLISAIGEGEGNDAAIVFTVDTKRARTEVRAQKTQAPLIRSLVASASNNLNRDPQIGRTLFQLLVPKEIEAFLGGSTETQLEVNRATAGVPWELLDVREAGSSDPRPWAIRTKLLRKLRTATFRDTVADAGADDGVLVIGDPAADRTRYPRLFGARREAMAVARALEGSAENRRYVRSIASQLNLTSAEPDAKTVINAVLEREWRIVHVAGHGEAPERLGEKDGNPRGVVLSDGAFLGPREIECMRTVPELVFVNCCHLAGRNINQLLSPDEPTRAEFAAGVAEALIGIGVRCVVAAGWAVDDDPANAFATSFYTALLGGCRFIDAVAQAREDARRLGGNTWAAYQCYGDPDWRYRPETGDAQRPTPPVDEFAAVSSANALALALETLAVRSEFQHADHDGQAQRIRYLETTFGERWGQIGAVAEAFGNAWGKNGDLPNAIGWYERARMAPDGSASMAALEQLANFYVRTAWARVESAQEEAAGRPPSRVSLPRTSRIGGSGLGARGSGRSRKGARKGAGKRRHDEPLASPIAAAVKTSLADLAKARELLDRLIAVDPTVERLSLYGSLRKREAMVQGAAGDAEAERTALAEMRRCYRDARELAARRPSSDEYYPRMNVLAAELATPASGTMQIPVKELAEIREVLAQRVAASPDFWNVVGQTELKMYEALAAGSLAKAREALWEEFSRHHQRVGAPRMWQSVCDNATLVLRRYALERGGGEAKAADSLLAALRSLAG